MVLRTLGTSMFWDVRSKKGREKTSNQTFPNCVYEREKKRERKP